MVPWSPLMLNDSIEYCSTFSVSSEVTVVSFSILLSSPTVVEAGVKASCFLSMSVEEVVTVMTPEEISSLRFSILSASSVSAANKVTDDLVVVVVKVVVVEVVVVVVVVVVVNSNTFVVDEEFVSEPSDPFFLSTVGDTEVITGEKLFISLSLLNCSLSLSKQDLISVSV